MIRTTLGRLIAAAALALSCAACGPSYMMHVDSPGVAIQPSATEAVVVFVRPGAGAPELVLDSTRHFYGNAMSGSYFAVRVPAGDHIFVLWSDTTYGFKARLVAGKTYFAGIRLTRATFEGLTPRSEGWAALPGALKTTVQYIPDQKGGQAYVDSRGADANARIAEVTKIFDALPADAPPAISPDDGLPAGEDIATAVAKANAARTPPPPPAHAAPPPPAHAAPPPPPPPRAMPAMPPKK